MCNYPLIDYGYYTEFINEWMANFTRPRRELLRGDVFSKQRIKEAVLKILSESDSRLDIEVLLRLVQEDSEEFSEVDAFSLFDACMGLYMSDPVGQDLILAHDLWIIPE